MVAIIVYAIVAVAAVTLLVIARSWIIIYNKFQYWKNKAEKRFAGIDVIMQQRLDMLPALAQAIKKYDIHEYKALKDTIEARSRWTKDAPLNERVQAAQEIENNFLKIQAVFERYPKLQAERLHERIMGRGNISHMEQKLAKYRLATIKLSSSIIDEFRYFLEISWQKFTASRSLSISRWEINKIKTSKKSITQRDYSMIRWQL